MMKNKGKEFLKAMGLSASAVGLFGAAFMGINTLAFAASTGAAEGPAPVAEAVVIPGEQTPPEGFVAPTVTVFVNDSWSTASANALSPDDAALIAAQYVWEVFGESIDGKYVTIWYSAHPSHARAYWMGNITTAVWETPGRDASREELMRYRERHEMSMRYSFSIDAVTGEWIDIMRLTAGARTTMPDAVMDAISELSRDRSRFDEFYTLRRGGPIPNPLDGYAQTAKEHAARHFVNTEVVSAAFVQVGASGFDMDENGNFFATARQLIFEVTDNTGRVAEVSFDEATGQLFRISTRHNDFVPGFRFEDDGRGIG